MQLAPEQKLAIFNLDPGIYPNVPFDEYLRVPLMSQSVLKCGMESMLHMQYAIDHIGQDKPTDAMQLGSALHVAFLEPESMLDRVAMYEDRRAGKDWEAFKLDNVGRIILTKNQYEKLKGMVRKLRANAEVRKWLSRIDAVEVSGIGAVHGLKMKCRADALTDDPLWDLKKIASTDDRSIDSAIESYGYHIQAYIYRHVFKRDRFCLGFVEEEAPHDVRVIELSPNWMKIAKAEVIDLVQQYQYCTKTGVWPGRSSKIEVREPPEWKLKISGIGDEISIGGERAFA